MALIKIVANSHTLHLTGELDVSLDSLRELFIKQNGTKGQAQ